MTDADATIRELRDVLRRIALPGTLVTSADAEVLRAAGVPLRPWFASASAQERREPTAYQVVAPEDVR